MSEVAQQYIWNNITIDKLYNGKWNTESIINQKCCVTENETLKALSIASKLLSPFYVLTLEYMLCCNRLAGRKQHRDAATEPQNACCVAIDWPIEGNIGMPATEPQSISVCCVAIDWSIKGNTWMPKIEPQILQSESEAHIGLSKFRHYLAHHAGPASRPLTLVSNSNCTKYNLRSQSFDNLNSKLYMTATDNIRGPVPFQHFHENLSAWKLIWCRP